MQNHIVGVVLGYGIRMEYLKITEGRLSYFALDGPSPALSCACDAPLTPSSQSTEC